MAEKKKLLGFKTPTFEIQEAFDEIRAQLDAVKIDWTEIRQVAKSAQSEAHKRCEAELKSSKTTTRLLDMAMHDWEYWFMIGIIARLGIEITETHERLASCEKAIKELKHRIK